MGGRPTERSWTRKAGAAGMGGSRRERSWAVALRQRHHRARPAVPIPHPRRWCMGRRAGWSVRAAMGGVINELDRPPDREELEADGRCGGHGRRSRCWQGDSPGSTSAADSPAS
uniref:Uncharacterized protein n=1 Tax=Oryza rufipogon TaxID=4529 RepID=A0A0E0NIG6_ORYRU